MDNNLLEKIENNPHLKDILVSLEDVLDNFDIYVYKNWYKGILVNGPLFRRHWISIILEYDLDSKPDPLFAERVEPLGIKINTKKRIIKLQQPKPQLLVKPLGTEDSLTDLNNQEEKETKTTWLVELMFPKRLIGDVTGLDLEQYDQHFDLSDLEQAEEQNIDNTAMAEER
jgi:hypothetical protein